MSPTLAVRRVDPAPLDDLEPLWLALHHHHRSSTTTVPIVPIASNDGARAFYERRGHVLGQIYLFTVGSTVARS